MHGSSARPSGIFLPGGEQGACAAEVELGVGHHAVHCDQDTIRSGSRKYTAAAGIQPLVSVAKNESGVRPELPQVGTRQLDLATVLATGDAVNVAARLEQAAAPAFRSRRLRC